MQKAFSQHPKKVRRKKVKIMLVLNSNEYIVFQDFDVVEILDKMTNEKSFINLDSTSVVAELLECFATSTNIQEYSQEIANYLFEHENLVREDNGTFVVRKVTYRDMLINRVENYYDEPLNKRNENIGLVYTTIGDREEVEVEYFINIVNKTETIKTYNYEYTKSYKSYEDMLESFGYIHDENLLQKIYDIVGDRYDI